MTPTAEPNHRLNLALAKLDAPTRLEFDERAGILEFDGGLSMVDAERKAWTIVVLKRGEGG